MKKHKDTGAASSKGKPEGTVKKVPKIKKPNVNLEIPQPNHSHYDLPGWVHDFKGYDLEALELPKEAYPQDRPNLGKHGYTLVSPHTKAVLRLYHFVLCLLLSFAVVDSCYLCKSHRI